MGAQFSAIPEEASAAKVMSRNIPSPDDVPQPRVNTKLDPPASDLASKVRQIIH